MYIKNRLGLTEGTETMLAQERRLALISNDLANINRAGYKKEGITFWEMLFTAQDDRQRVGKALNVNTIHEQGEFENTGNPLDFAIGGQGFFKVQTANGIRYTRNGNFTLNGQGQLSTMQGNLVMGQGGPITLASDQAQVGRDGLITIDGEAVNQLAIVTFNDLDGLTREGANTFKLADEQMAEQPVADPLIMQNHLEASNVNAIDEMTEMIDLQRAFQSQQKIIQTIDEINGQAISRVGKLT